MMVAQTWRIGTNPLDNFQKFSCAIDIIKMLIKTSGNQNMHSCRYLGILVSSKHIQPFDLDLVIAYLLASAIRIRTLR